MRKVSLFHIDAISDKFKQIMLKTLFPLVTNFFTLRQALHTEYTTQNNIKILQWLKIIRERQFYRLECQEKYCKLH